MILFNKLWTHVIKIFKKVTEPSKIVNFVVFTQNLINNPKVVDNNDDGVFN